MPLIKKMSDTILGDFNVNFSTLHDEFKVDVKLPLGFEKNYHLKCWDDVINYIEEIKIATMYDSKFVKKIIYIDFKTSETTTLDEKSQDVLLKNKDKMNDGIGFKLNWYVLDEFTTHSGRNNIFKIVESHSGDFINKKNIGKMDILGQLFYGDGRSFEYTDELYNFLINTTDQLKEILKHMSEFINPDPKKLMDNILNNNGQLKLGK